MKRTDTKKSLTVRQSKDNGLFLNELTDTKAMRLLNEAVKARKQAQYPNVPDYALTIPKYEDATTNGLTKCIIDFLNSQDHCSCFRISNEGVMRTDKYGKPFLAKSSMQNGISDLIACVWGRFVSIEIKVATDRQSEAQKEYQKSIENAKGYYLIVKDFDSFLTWFLGKMEAIKAKKGVQNE